MRGLALVLALISTSAAAGQRTVGIGEVLATIDTELRENVRLATTGAAIDRTIYLVEKLQLPAGSVLEWSEASRSYCSADKGYITSYGDESGVCLSDTDADGKFDTVTGVGIVKPVKLKNPAPFSTRIGSVTSRSPVQRRIVYLGGTASEARFSYREFTRDGMARPAFTEDLTVPLNGFPASFTLKGISLIVHGQGPSGLDVDIAN